MAEIQFNRYWLSEIFMEVNMLNDDRNKFCKEPNRKITEHCSYYDGSVQEKILCSKCLIDKFFEKYDNNEFNFNDKNTYEADVIIKVEQLNPCWVEAKSEEEAVKLFNEDYGECDYPIELNSEIIEITNVKCVEEVDSCPYSKDEIRIILEKYVEYNEYSRWSSSNDFIREFREGKIKF